MNHSLEGIDLKKDEFHLHSSNTENDANLNKQIQFHSNENHLHSNEKREEMSNGVLENDVSLQILEKKYMTEKLRADENEKILKDAFTQLASLQTSLASQKTFYENELSVVKMERDKRKKDLDRLKQHLLETETAESEKMENDLQKISDLETNLQISQQNFSNLEKKYQDSQKILSEVSRKTSDSEKRFSDEILFLKSEISKYQNLVKSKDVELNNLQSALGQYYAEIESKEKLLAELSHLKEKMKQMTMNYENSLQELQNERNEKENVMKRLSDFETRLTQSESVKVKSSQEILTLRKALEQSMIRINRMSHDSDFLVDRRIVIKLMTTYFEKNFSNEVLDLMTRMLGFSESEKSNIRSARQNQGIVKNVIGISTSFVGSFMRTVNTDTSSSVVIPNENTSFTDLWIDFLLKESEEREKRERAEREEKVEKDEKVKKEERQMQSPFQYSNSPSSTSFSSSSSISSLPPLSSHHSSMSNPPSTNNYELSNAYSLSTSSHSSPFSSPSISSSLPSQSLSKGYSLSPLHHSSMVENEHSFNTLPPPTLTTRSHVARDFTNQSNGFDLNQLDLVAGEFSSISLTASSSTTLPFSSLPFSSPSPSSSLSPLSFSSSSIPTEYGFSKQTESRFGRER